jgi:hypothetical protein
MAEGMARKLAGSLDLVCQGGFVRSIRAPSSAILIKKRGELDMSLLLDVGEPPQVFGQGLPISPPSEGWLRLTPSGRVRLHDGVVQEIQLEIQDEPLFEALQAMPDR